MNAAEQTERIDSFIRKHLTEAKSEAGISASDAAKAAARHGFTGCANVRYAQFLEALRSNPVMSADYAERYPACQFLPWSAFHAVRTSLKLWFDLPEFYAGAIPPEQLPWMDVFELDGKDAVSPSDATALLQLTGQHAQYLEIVCDPYRNFDGGDDIRFPDINPMLRAAAAQDRYAAPIRNLYRQFQKSFFVLAPQDAFTTLEDFIKRFRMAVQEARTQVTVPPNDPLVVKPCKGGVLVVAAWGDEAAFLNEAVKELNL